MVRRLIPYNESFFDLFEEQANIAYESVAILRQMVVEVRINSTWHEIMRDIEHRADIVTARIIKKAEQLFSTPFDTEDIYALAVTFDDVVDAVEEVVQRVVLYQFVPDEALKKFFSLLSEGVLHICEGMRTLRHLENQDACRRKMTDCEHAADALFESLIPQSWMLCVGDLVKKNGDDQITVMDMQRIIDEYSHKRMHREITELTETAVDSCKKVFHMLGNIYLKET